MYNPNTEDLKTVLDNIRKAVKLEAHGEQRVKLKLKALMLEAQIGLMEEDNGNYSQIKKAS